MNDVKFVPGLHWNSLSLSKAMKVFELSGKDDQLKFKLKSLEYCFDHKIKSGLGFIFGLKVMTGKGDTFVPYEKGHMFLTHTNKMRTKATIKKLNYSLGAVPTNHASTAPLPRQNKRTSAK